MSELRLKKPSGIRMYLVSYKVEKDGAEKPVPLSSRQVLSDSVVLSRRKVERDIVQALIEDLSPNEMMDRIFAK